MYWYVVVHGAGFFASCVNVGTTGEMIGNLSLTAVFELQNIPFS